MLASTDWARDETAKKKRPKPNRMNFFIEVRPFVRSLMWKFSAAAEVGGRP